MTSLGSVALRIRQKYGDGLRAAYFRDTVRPKILKTPPVECGQDDTCEIHVLTSATDFVNLIWAVKSFYRYSKRRYGLCIHSDGTLDGAAADALRSHFPGARIIERAQADREVDEYLRPYRRCADFRSSNHLAPKVFDFPYYLRSDRMLLLDSDILFFDMPQTLLRRIEDPSYLLNSANTDCDSAYTVDPAVVVSKCGVALQPRFNSGLGLIHRSSLRPDWIEEFLGLPGIIGHFWRIEQTLYALCSSRFGVELLPEEYDVRLDAGLRGQVCRHYVGRIRHLMYSEGMRRLVRNGFLDLVE